MWNSSTSISTIRAARNAECQSAEFESHEASATQDTVDLPKMVQVVCRFQSDELLDCLPSAYLVDPIALHPKCARDRLQQSQVALAQSPKDPCRKARILLRVTQALRPCRLIPPRQGHARVRQHV